MAKITPLSGFPEYTPEQRLIEQHFLDAIRRNFELYGFTSIETRSVEPLDQLLRKGETDKEIYVLKRLHAQEDEGHKGLGLHYDMTVPFARYVEQFRGQLNFPFKRYQMQKAWRGERPQEGRYREFVQCDIDVVDENELSLDFDAELPRILHSILSSLPIPPVQIHINNRKILEGFYRALGIDDPAPVIREVDKLDKIGKDGLTKQLRDHLGLEHEAIDKILTLAGITGRDSTVLDQVRALVPSHDLLEEGLTELAFVMDALADLPEGGFIADLRLARGFDYYTGTVYESFLQGHESLGAICSGGRYDNLVASVGNRKYPGVGMSIGLSRILGRLFGKNLLTASRRTPTVVLVALHDEEGKQASRNVANALRARGINCETFHKVAKYGKQIKYANQRGIPYVWFPPRDGETGHEIRDIQTGDQGPVDLETWSPAEEHAAIQFGSAVDSDA